MKNAARRLALATVALIATAGVIALPSSAEADSAWPYRTTVHHSSTR